MTYLGRPGVSDWHNAQGALEFMGVDRRRWRIDFSTQVEEGDIVVLRLGRIEEMGPNDVLTLPG